MGYNFKRLSGDMLRFGFSLPKAINRLTHSNKAKLFCNSIPKSGTHLLERALCLYGPYHRPICPTMRPFIHGSDRLEKQLIKLRPSQFLIAHWMYTEELEHLLHDLHIKPVMMIRDPRAIILSDIRYAESLRDHYQREHYKECKTLEEKLLRSIDGSAKTGWWPLNERLDMYTGWLGRAHIVRFEELMDSATRCTVLRTLFDYMEESPTESEIVRISRKLISSASPTYRGGGDSSKWQDLYTDKVKDHFKNVAGQQLISLGYETSRDW